MMNSTSARSHSFAALALTSLIAVIGLASGQPCLAGAAEARAEGPPRSMRHLVLNSKHRRVHSLKLGAQEFRTITLRDDVPFLVWPGPGVAVPFTRDQAEVKRWLSVNLPALGVHGFEPAFDEAWTWRQNQVWTFRLRRAGLELQDARIDFHWNDGGFEGLRVFVQRPILTREADPSGGARAGTERTWYPKRRIEGELDGYDIVLADVQRTTVAQHTRTQYRSAGQLLSTVVGATPAGPATPAIPHQWTEYDVPSGVFPDQIGSDSTGKIWFTQPNNNKVTSFDPVSETFFSPPVSLPVPDGMIVDSQDRLWTGLYSPGAGMGLVDVLSGTYSSFQATYSNAKMAIPFESSTGDIWVSDHEGNRVSVFDPLTSTFTNSYVMPTADAWVVDGAQAPSSATMYFQEYNTNKLAIKPPGQPMYDFPATNGGPAFVVHSNGKIYIGLWHVSRLGEYDIASGLITEYAYPDANNVGGPVDVLANGDVVATGRNFGAVYVFRLATQTFDRFLIPTNSAGIKDGVHVDASGTIWVTESGANKLAKLRLH